MTFRILLVCSANLCRSPIAEFMLRHQLTLRGMSWIVESAGTVARPGLPMHPRSVEVLGERGIEVDDGWVSRQLTGSMIDRADLVLTAAVEHRAAVVSSRPAALPHAFTLLQFARLAERIRPLEGGDDQELGERFVAAARASRHLIQYTDTKRDDIVDPIHGRRNSFKHCTEAIARAVTGMTMPLPTR